MERLRGTVPAILAYLGVTIALLSWGTFLTDPAHYRGPLIVIGLAVMVGGIASRAARLPGAVVLLVQLAVALMALSIALSHAPLPITGASRALLAQTFADARTVFIEQRPPVAVRGGVAAVVLPGGALAYLLADLLAATARRTSLAGLVLLATLSVPLSAVQRGGGWLVFALTAGVFVAMLAAQEGDRVLHWGRRVDVAGPVAPPGGAVGRSGAVGAAGTAGAAAIGLTATALAVIVPLGLPMLHVDVSGIGGSGNGKGPITVTNPMVGMYGSLKGQSTTELVDVSVRGGAAAPPSYLRIAVLTQFNGEEWSTGDRHIPTTQTAHQSIGSPYDDLGPTTSYSISATSAFTSNWLPAFDFTTDIDAPGDWRFDTDTYDFISADKGLTTAGLSWTDTAAEVTPDEKALRKAAFDPNGVDPRYTALPSDFPTDITSRALQITENQPTPFLQAVALQDWFLHDGHFTYSLQRPAGDSNQDLLSFVTDHRVGYCQQFATAMAAMARAIGIPARVAVGFLHAAQNPDGSYVFRGSDMHAWPELWFQGVGWVRFDPTPGVGATPPSYTQVPLAKAGQTDEPQTAPSTAPNTHGQGQQAPKPTPQKPDPTTHAAAPAATSQAGRSWTWLWVGGGIVVAAALALVPAWLRRRRRRQRLAGGIEDVWDELADTARDIGVPWPDGLSPRGQSTRLSTHVVTPQGRESLGRLVGTLEWTRYARPGEHPTPAPGTDGRQVIDGLLEGVERGVRRRAAIAPRSLFGRRDRRPVRRTEEQSLVDRTG